jgi:ceramide glucosyltransferase
MLRNLLPFVAVLPATVYSLLSLWCGWNFFKGQGTGGKGHAVPITILKPVKGMDEGSYENFASFCRQQYDAPVQLIFAVASSSDPAISVIKQLIADFTGHD